MSSETPLKLKELLLLLQNSDPVKRERALKKLSKILFNQNATNFQDTIINAISKNASGDQARNIRTMANNILHRHLQVQEEIESQKKRGNYLPQTVIIVMCLIIAVILLRLPPPKKSVNTQSENPEEATSHTEEKNTTRADFQGPPGKTFHTEKELRKEELFRKFAPAVVQIHTRTRKFIMNIGTGFFISPEGHLVTNYHVMRGMFAPDFRIHFKLQNRIIITSFTIGVCGDARNTDICILKLNYRPPVWFSLKQVIPSPGEKVFVIGHPEGKPYVLFEGTLIASIKTTLPPLPDLAIINDKPIEFVEISAPIVHGNSGAPIFNNHGHLLGVATMSSLNYSRYRYFGTSTGALIDLYQDIQRFQTIQEYGYRQKNRWTSLNSQIKASYGEGNITAYERTGKLPSSSSKYYKTLQVVPFGRAFKFTLPSPFLINPCFVVKGRRTVSYSCQDSLYRAGNLTLIFKRMRKNALYSHRMWDRYPRKLPSFTVKKLMNSSDWPIFKKRVSAQQLENLFTLFEPWTYDYNATLKKHLCFSRSRDNPSDISDSMLRALVQKENDPVLIEITGRASRSVFSALYFHGAKIAAFSVR